MSYPKNRKAYESMFARLSPDEQRHHMSLLLGIIAALIRGDDWRAVLPSSPRPRRPTTPGHRRKR